MERNKIIELTKLVKTKFKTRRMLIAASQTANTWNEKAVDCPFPFYHAGKYKMFFVGFDGKGYQTGMAESSDLLNWQNQQLVLARDESRPLLRYNIAMPQIIRDNELFGSGELKKIAGKYVGCYHAYPDSGYEAGPAAIGLAFSDDLKAWDVQEPILEADPNAPWQAGGLYKGWVVEDDGRFYLFYNAKNKANKGEAWIEQTGVALSDDLKRWQNHPDNPLLRIGGCGAFDELYASDPVVLKHEDTWIMFYFGLSKDRHARDSVAFSEDLLNWHKSEEILIDVGQAGSLDAQYAHKPGIIAKDGKLYHFYCAVSKKYGRGISLAHS